LRPRFGGCDGGRPAPLAAAATRVRVSAFWAAFRASGAASRPELSLPLYGSVIFTCSFLRLRSPMRSVAGGPGDDVVAGRVLFRCRFAPIRKAVSVHVPWLGGMASLSGRGLSGDCEFWTMAARCDSTIRRLQTISGDDSAPSLRNALETAITFSRIETALTSLRAPTEPS